MHKKLEEFLNFSEEELELYGKPDQDLYDALDPLVEGLEKYADYLFVSPMYGGGIAIRYEIGKQEVLLEINRGKRHDEGVWDIKILGLLVPKK